jgi:hypothetical protein
MFLELFGNLEGLGKAVNKNITNFTRNGWDWKKQPNSEHNVIQRHWIILIKQILTVFT